MRHLALTTAPLATLGLLLAAPPVQAEEPRKVSEPSVLQEPAQVTDVVDAFDDTDKFDLHLSLGFQQTWKGGNIHRETHSDLNQFSSGGFTAGNMDVAKYTETTSRLNTRADVGIFKDIALVLRLPIILSHDRKLGDLSGSSANQSITTQGVPGEQLFSIPFQSPTRSGIEYLAVGLDFGPFNQHRDYTKPTWVIGFEGRFNVSEPMHACNNNVAPLNISQQALSPASQQVQCANFSDINRNGFAGESRYLDSRSGVQLEGSNFQGGRNPGVSRGTTGLQVHTYMSKRVKYIEPYGGFDALFEFQNESSDYGISDLQGSLVNHPPFQGSLVGGLAVFPWEVRDQFQRIEIDFRVRGTYRSEGRDYSPLFDALGSSDAPSLRRPNFAQFNQGPNADNPSVVNTGSQKVYMTGITDVQQHGIYTFSTQFTFQAGEYVKFNIGGAFTAFQGHIITFDQPCNPDFKNEIASAGPCRSGSRTAGFEPTGIPNPNYRAAINAPGRRFRFDDATAWDAWVNAVVMF
jgi:hypothetical protein